MILFITGEKTMYSILKKIVCGVMVLVTSIGLLGCGIMKSFNSDRIDKNAVGELMEEILADLFKSINQKQEKIFDSFFADHVLAMSDFEKGKNHVFESYKGDLINIYCKFPMGTGKHILPGEHICYAFTTFDIITSNNEYTAYIEFYTKNPKNQYKIRKFKLLEKQALDNGENFNDCTQRYGIYYPDWLN